MSRKVVRVVVLAAAALILAAVAHAGPTPVTGAAYTTVNVGNDGSGHCFNGTGFINCNIYDGKQFVWFNGGPAANSLSPSTGVYSITVLAPGGQPDPNDGAPKNLSDDYDCWQNRTVQLSAGEAVATPAPGVVVPPGCFPGGIPFSHLFTSPLYRLYPYANTTNNGGVYIMSVCYRGPAGGPYANVVDPKYCKYDAFKVRPPQAGPPICALFQVIHGPPKQIQILVQDPTTGIEDITVDIASNASVNVPAFFVGDMDPILVTATKIDQSQSAQVAITVRTVSGFELTCDPVLKPKRLVFGAKRLARLAKASTLR